MKQYFDSLNVILVDFKLEFGKTADGTIVLADEISPDTCRLWDKTTKEKLERTASAAIWAVSRRHIRRS